MVPNSKARVPDIPNAKDFAYFLAWGNRRLINKIVFAPLKFKYVVSDYFVILFTINLLVVFWRTKELDGSLDEGQKSIAQAHAFPKSGRNLRYVFKALCAIMAVNWAVVSKIYDHSTLLKYCFWEERKKMLINSLQKFEIIYCHKNGFLSICIYLCYSNEGKSWHIGPIWMHAQVFHTRIISLGRKVPCKSSIPKIISGM